MAGRAARTTDTWLATPPPDADLARGPMPARLGNVSIGTASWTEKTLLASRAFYPASASTPERRLRYYAHHFPVVEVDATYYALPSPANARAWADRTPPDFAFGVKAYAALTGHPIEPARLDRDLQRELPADLRRERRVYPRDLPPAVEEAIWARFHDALAPLRDAGKLAYVLFQMPRWFAATRGNAALLETLPARLPDSPIAVEFRQATWMLEERRERTLALLRKHRLTYVCVDEPQGTPASVPPVAAVTTDDLAVVRFHGRRQATWTKVGATTTERFGYTYSRDELREWVDPIRDLARSARRVHLLMNNCHRESAVRNAKDLAELLSDAAATASPRRRGS